jgi:SPP1 family predicted phage head-tail adaptor
MNSGKMRHRVTIQEPIESKGEMGGTTKQWVEFHTCWADVRELSGRERILDGQLQSDITARAFIRYTANINSSMRLVHGEKVYQIESAINKDGKNAMLELLLYEFR